MPAQPHRPDIPADARPCPDHPGYWITPGVAGAEPPRVFSQHPRTGRYRELVSRVIGADLGRHHRIMLCVDGLRTFAALRTLVARAFLGPPPAGLVVHCKEADPALVTDPSLYSKDGSVRLQYASWDATVDAAIARGAVRRHPPAARERAKAMREQGRPYSAIAAEVGASINTVWEWVNGLTAEQIDSRRQTRKRTAKRARARRRTRILIEPLP